jgi:hypothetical protein
MVVLGLTAGGDFIGSFRGDDWPHVHSCPICGTLISCECPFGEMDFDDTLSRCPKCKFK